MGFGRSLQGCSITWQASWWPGDLKWHHMDRWWLAGWGDVLFQQVTASLIPWYSQSFRHSKRSSPSGKHSQVFVYVAFANVPLANASHMLCDSRDGEIDSTLCWGMFAMYFNIYVHQDRPSAGHKTGLKKFKRIETIGYIL